MEQAQEAREILRELIEKMRRGYFHMPYDFIFRVEDCKKMLFMEFQSLCPAGSSLAEPPAELEHIHTAILRLSSLTLFGGFGSTFNMIIATLEEAKRDLSLHINDGDSSLK